MGRLNFIYILISFSLLFFTCKNNSEIQSHATAVDLNKKAIRILTYAEAQNLTPNQQSLLVLSILDSATEIDQKYYAADINKLSSLISLKKYDEAVKIIDKVIKGDPNNFRTYIKGGIIYMDYINDEAVSKNYFKDAYLTSLKNLKKDENISNDFNVALSLLYFKDKRTALSHLDHSLSKYKNSNKFTAQLEIGRNLIANYVLSKQNNFTWFTSYNSETY